MRTEQTGLSWAGAILAALAALYLYMLGVGLLQGVGERIAQ
jgi:hypothetical protein